MTSSAGWCHCWKLLKWSSAGQQEERLLFQQLIHSVTVGRRREGAECLTNIFDLFASLSQEHSLIPFRNVSWTCSALLHLCLMNIFDSVASLSHKHLWFRYFFVSRISLILFPLSDSLNNWFTDSVLMKQLFLTTNQYFTTRNVIPASLSLYLWVPLHHVTHAFFFIAIFI